MRLRQNVESFDAVAPVGHRPAPIALGMTPLPRYLALALFVVLTALVVLLAVSTWHEARSSGVGIPDADTSTAQAVLLAQRLELGLAIVGVGLALALAVSLALRPAQAPVAAATLATARQEMDTLSRLAASTTAQGAELDRERDVRRRAEEDAHLKQQLLRQSVDEKIRLGHDLHDGIIQSLYAVGLTLETVRTLVQTDPAEAERRLEQTRTHLNATIRDVRAYIAGLTPENLRQAGFARAATTLLNELAAGREAQFDVKLDDDAALLLTPDQSLEALQLAREAVSNALRHGAASHITLRVQHLDGEVCLLVQDNGGGFDVARRREGGHGLANMQARAARVGATLRIQSEPGAGTRIVVTFPVAAGISA